VLTLVPWTERFNDGCSGAKARPVTPGEAVAADRAGRACCVARDPRTNNAFEGKFRDILKERGTEAPYLVDETIFPSRDTFLKQFRV
jgi:hypothetical protein